MAGSSFIERMAFAKYTGRWQEALAADRLTRSIPHGYPFRMCGWHDHKGVMCGRTVGLIEGGHEPLCSEHHSQFHSRE